MTRHTHRHFAAALATALICALGTPIASAHDDAYLDTVKTPHGGQLRMAGPLHLELVLDKNGSELKERTVSVYIADHADQPISAKGAKGSITLLAGKVKVSGDLKVDGDNRLTGKLKYAAVPGIKAVVTVTMPGQSPQQARFTPMTSTTKPEHAHDDHAHDGHEHDGHTTHKH